jgi:sulfite reductase (ferredoxin)
VASPAKPVRKAKKLSVEEIKAASNYLSEGVAEHVFDETTDHVEDTVYQLLKFSGMYQQDDRDLRKQRRQEGKDKAYSFMLRSRAPGGRLSAAQYLMHDRLADSVGNGTLRLTTRQGIQLHGILKGDIQKTIRTLHSEMVTSLAACGDVNRNVMACPAPEVSRKHALLEEVADEINAHLLPKSEAYYQLWLDGERQPLPTAATPEPVAKADDVEPIYGKTYLPRKFKIGIAFPEDNCVDVFSQDIGIVPVLDGEALRGFNLLIGGGLGMSHTDPDTRPFLAKELGFVTREQLLRTVEGIVTVQRDFGNREERKFARMKWLVETRGIPWFKAELESRLGFTLGDWVDVGRFTLDDHLGWREGGDGTFYFGIHIENGRVKDDGDFRLRTALRELLTRYPNEIRITAQHNILLTDLKAEDEAPIRDLLRAHGVKTTEEISQARRFAMACPALPTCGLAVAESERMLPGVIDVLEKELAALGLAGDEISIRMTGCPNGCARPYTAELAFVGKSLDKYNVYVGGSFEGTRLVSEYAEMVSGGDLVATVTPLLRFWREARRQGERFGDFCHRVGLEGLRDYAAGAVAA